MRKLLPLAVALLASCYNPPPPKNPDPVPQCEPAPSTAKRISARQGERRVKVTNVGGRVDVSGELYFDVDDVGEISEPYPVDAGAD